MDQKKRLALIVDDNEVILKTLALKLSANGYHVATALDGSEALAIVRRQRPDVILLDIGFPPDVAHGGGVPWDGFLIIEWFNRMAEAKGVPIIIITASEDAQYKKRALASGAAAFFHKPFDNDELLTTIEKVLAKDQSQLTASA